MAYFQKYVVIIVGNDGDFYTTFFPEFRLDDAVKFAISNKGETDTAIVLNCGSEKTEWDSKSETCNHDHGTNVERYNYCMATLEQPEEYEERATCSNCGAVMSTEDFPGWATFD